MANRTTGKELKRKGVKDDSMALPFEMIQENYPKKIQSVIFDKVDYVLIFRAGKDGVGAVVSLIWLSL